MPGPTMIAESTVNRDYPVPVSTNSLAYDINRIRLALTRVDQDVAELILAIANAAGLDSPALTGTPTAPTAVPGTNTNVLATTAFVMAALAAFDISDVAPLDSPTFTGSPTGPTAALSDNSTKLANTAFVQGLIGQLIGAAPETLNTIQELAAAFQNNPNVIAGLIDTVATKASQSDVDTKLPIVQPFVDLASSSTVALASAGSQNVRITGSTTISSFGSGTSGMIKRIRFTGSLTLVHNAGSLILPGAGNISTSSNDTLLAICLGGSNWFVLEYNFASRSKERDALGLGSLALWNVSDLSYTGNSSSNTDYPVGETVVVASGERDRNALSGVYLSTSSAQEFIFTPTVAQLAGTWRARGLAGGSRTLMRRVG